MVIHENKYSRVRTQLERCDVFLWFVCFTNGIPQYEYDCPLRLIDANYKALFVACMNLTRFTRQLCFFVFVVLTLCSKNQSAINEKKNNNKLIYEMLIRVQKRKANFSFVLEIRFLISHSSFESWFSRTKNCEKKRNFLMTLFTYKFRTQYVCHLN